MQGHELERLSLDLQKEFLGGPPGAFVCFPVALTVVGPEVFSHHDHEYRAGPELRFSNALHYSKRLIEIIEVPPPACVPSFFASDETMLDRAEIESAFLLDCSIDGMLEAFSGIEGLPYGFFGHVIQRIVLPVSYDPPLSHDLELIIPDFFDDDSKHYRSDLFLLFLLFLVRHLQLPYVSIVCA